MTTKKLERDDQVAVLYSPGFGAGWSTWNSEHDETLLFDSEIAQAVIDGNIAQAIAIAEQKCPGIYTGGGDGLTVLWITKGQCFEVEEYDGSESIHVIGSRFYHIA